jgi:hypothetical protein
MRKLICGFFSLGIETILVLSQHAGIRDSNFWRKAKVNLNVVRWLYLL